MRFASIALLTVCLIGGDAVPFGLSQAKAGICRHHCGQKNGKCRLRRILRPLAVFKRRSACGTTHGPICSGKRRCSR